MIGDSIGDLLRMVATSCGEEALHAGQIGPIQLACHVAKEPLLLICTETTLAAPDTGFHHIGSELIELAAALQLFDRLIGVGSLKRLQPVRRRPGITIWVPCQFHGWLRVDNTPRGLAVVERPPGPRDAAGWRRLPSVACWRRAIAWTSTLLTAATLRLSLKALNKIALFVAFDWGLFAVLICLIVQHGIHVVESRVDTREVASAETTIGLLTSPDARTRVIARLFFARRTALAV
ncbi:MAG: hypothetical protein FWD68_00630 [Alphaproteobacteria bacterium]|nr:hypothetical protein [Alphaproteobacteria bacterium]